MKKTLLIIGIIIAKLILILTIRGVYGNPIPSDISSKLSMQGQPFELSPERGRYGLVMSLSENNSVTFTEEIAEFVIPDLGYLDGRYVSLFAPGVSVIALPFYELGKNLNLAQVFTFYVPALFAFLNFILIIIIVKKITGNSLIGLLSAYIFLFSTIAWSYAVSLYQHHISTFILLLILNIILSKKNIFQPFVVGLLFGLSFFVDYPNVLFLVPFLSLLVVKYIDVKQFKSKAKVSLDLKVLLIVVGLFLSLIPTFWYNKLAYGDYLQLAGTVPNLRDLDDAGLFNYVEDEKSVSGFFELSKVPIGASVLISSSDRGIFVFSPVLLLFIFGFLPLYKQNKKLSIFLLLTVLTIFGLYSMWGDPWGGWAFGSRYLVPAISLMSILIGIATYEYRGKIWYTIALVWTLAISIIVSLSGALTTNQLPPSVEADYANFPELIYMYNISLVRTGKISSFAYNNYIESFIAPVTFSIALFLAVWIISVLSYLAVCNKDK